jgi:hypothetical protein
MDLVSYVEHQRKQRMVMRLHKEALLAMCAFWKSLDSSSISFTHLTRSLNKIEVASKQVGARDRRGRPLCTPCCDVELARVSWRPNSEPQAQSAYRHVLERYPNAPKLVRLYGKFLETIKNDPWGAVSDSSGSCPLRIGTPR